MQENPVSYLVVTHDYDEHTIHGCFATKELADEFVAIHAFGDGKNALGDGVFVEEWPVWSTLIAPTKWRVRFPRRTRRTPNHLIATSVQVVIPLTDSDQPSCRFSSDEFVWCGMAETAQSAVQLGIEAYEAWLKTKPEWPKDDDYRSYPTCPVVP